MYTTMVKYVYVEHVVVCSCVVLLGPYFGFCFLEGKYISGYCLEFDSLVGQQNAHLYT